MLAGPITHPLAGWPGVGKIIVVIPACNEARFIRSAVLAARQVWLGAGDGGNGVWDCAGGAQDVEVQG